MTTYSIDYISSKAYSKLPPINPKENGIIFSTDYCNQSSYNEDYYSKERADPVKSYKPKNQYEQANEKFSAQSIYSEDYIYCTLPKQKSLKPIVSYSLPTDAFESITNYKADFAEKSVEKSAPKKPIDSYKSSRSNDENLLSHNLQNGVHFKADQVRSFRPNILQMPTEKDESWSSSYQDEYKTFPLNKVVSTKLSSSSNFVFPNSSNQTGGTEKYLSNYQDSFTRNQGSIEKIANFKPRNEYKSPAEVFHLSTNYTSDFEKFAIEPRKSFKPINIYQPPDEPLTSRSSYGEDFIMSTTPAKVKSIKPMHQITISNDPIEFVTDYSKEYCRN